MCRVDIRNICHKVEISLVWNVDTSTCYISLDSKARLLFVKHILRFTRDIKPSMFVHIK